MGRFFSLVLLVFLLPALAFADVTVIDSRGLTRASKRGVDSAEVILKLSSLDKQANTIRLLNQDGTGSSLEPDSVNGAEINFVSVPAGTWKVISSNHSYQIEIK